MELTPKQKQRLNQIAPLLLQAAKELIAAKHHPKNGDDGGAEEIAVAWLRLRSCVAAVDEVPNS